MKDDQMEAMLQAALDRAVAIGDPDAVETIKTSMENLGCNIFLPGEEDAPPQE